MNEQPKLSELLKQGAANLAPYQGEYFNDDRTCACAVGCALFAGHKLGVNSILDLYDLTIPDYDNVATKINLSRLPADVLAILSNIVEVREWDLHFLITHINDSISRDRAIEITEMLGY